MSSEGQRWEFTNRLIHEKSPYLLQHAHNPVDWYPWGQEAFNKAQNEDKPIFLSIGYATCHWCHVMEEESFSDKEVAYMLNEYFICIKVDREELPEIDSLYMDFAQAMIIGSTGWPLNLFLTPSLQPFFATTYLPKRFTSGMVGLIDLAEKIVQMWSDEEERARLIQQGEKIVELANKHANTKGIEIPPSELIPQTAELLFKIADPVWGGMKGAPKFPLGYQALFLINYFLHSRDARSLFLVEKTLEMMHRGGIYDHLGGGFHRYSVDEQWHVPHFEKMLYDNALLIRAYLYAWKITERELYKIVSEETLGYLERDMLDKGGGFYSAEDADSGGIEGLSYTWTRKEIVSLLGEEDADIFCDLFDVYDPGFIEGRSVLAMTASLEEFAANRKVAKQAIENQLVDMKKKLFKERSKRLPPFKDDKILVSWNGLAIQAFAEAGFMFANKHYTDTAKKAAQFIKEQMWRSPHLLRRYRDQEARFSASLDDYAFLTQGLLTLFETTGEVAWLAWTIELVEAIDVKFKVSDGAYYQSDDKTPGLIIRKAQFTDGAEPSGNAVHAENLLRLYQMSGDTRYLHAAEDIFRAAAKHMHSYSLGYCYELIALQCYYDEKRSSFVVALDSAEHGREEIAQAIAKKVFGFHTLVWKVPEDRSLGLFLPYTEKLNPVNDTTTLYICKEGHCEKPLVGVEQILQFLYT